MLEREREREREKWRHSRKRASARMQSFRKSDLFRFAVYTNIKKIASDGETKKPSRTSPYLQFKDISLNKQTTRPRNNCITIFDNSLINYQIHPTLVELQCTTSTGIWDRTDKVTSSMQPSGGSPCFLSSGADTHMSALFCYLEQENYLKFLILPKKRNKSNLQ